MFGFIPDDHPDLRPLVLHETYPEDFHPLRKCVDIDADVRGERKYEMAVSHGDGLFEVPVGPIHAGIIEPGHFLSLIHISSSGHLLKLLLILI